MDLRVIAPRPHAGWNSTTARHSPGPRSRGAQRSTGAPDGGSVTERARQPGSGSPATVIVCDPEMLVRAGLRSVIEADPTFRIRGEAANGSEALDLMASLQPRVAVVATSLRDPAGIDVVRRSREISPGTSVVILARADESRSMLDGFRAGAAGYLRSNMSRLDLLSALRRTLAGEAVIDSAAATELIVQMAAESELISRATADPLTPRERQILQLVAQGHTNRQIAERLIVAVGTIKVHVEHILGKLDATDRTQAAVRAVELGLVHGDETVQPTPN